MDVDMCGICFLTVVFSSVASACGFVDNKTFCVNISQLLTCLFLFTSCHLTHSTWCPQPLFGWILSSRLLCSTRIVPVNQTAAFWLLSCRRIAGRSGERVKIWRPSGLLCTRLAALNRTKQLATVNVSLKCIWNSISVKYEYTVFFS